MLPAWGQLLTYDLVQIVTPNTTSNCCLSQSNVRSELIECYVEPSNCKEYKRSVPSNDISTCEFKQREQMNAASGFIDGSGLYGITENDFLKLRTFVNGKVDITVCPHCMVSGAVGELHKVLLNEHNRICDGLVKLNPSWTDNTLFLEAKRIVSAEIQHITYNEFLPILLGLPIANKEELRLLSGVHYNKYSSTNRAGIFNEVAVGVFPAFLSMLPYGMMNGTVSSDILISKPALQKTYIPTSVDQHFNWTSIQYSIHQGRDHGIPAYYRFLNLCEARLGLTQNITFEDFETVGIPSSVVKILKTIYKNPEDVDLLVGALAEKPAPGTVFGPTISCMIASQFANLRVSDRFWYENDLPPSSLNLDQLQAIRRVSLSGLLCENKAIIKSQSKAFLRVDPYLNVRISCDQLPGLDLSAWKVDEPNYLIDDEEDFITERPAALEELSSEILNEAIERAKEELNERKRFEYETWLAREYHNRCVK